MASVLSAVVSLTVVVLLALVVLRDWSERGRAVVALVVSLSVLAVVAVEMVMAWRADEYVRFQMLVRGTVGLVGAMVGVVVLAAFGAMGVEPTPFSLTLPVTAGLGGFTGTGVVQQLRERAGDTPDQAAR